MSKESSSSPDSTSWITVARALAGRRLVGPSRVTRFSLFLRARAKTLATSRSDSASDSFRWEMSKTLEKLFSSSEAPCRPSEVSLLDS